MNSCKRKPRFDTLNTPHFRCYTIVCHSPTEDSTSDEATHLPFGTVILREDASWETSFESKGLSDMAITEDETQDLRQHLKYTGVDSTLNAT